MNIVKTLNYCGMEITSEIVTPDIAKKWLDLNIKNRKIKPRWVSKYARDMKNGDWHPIPSAIIFDKENILGNGQTRLQAIIDSGISLPLLIARNVSRESIAMHDKGSNWSNQETSKFLGKDLNKTKCSVVQIVAFGLKSSGKSYYELLNAYTSIKNEVDFIVSLCPHSKGFSAPLMAVCVKALFSQSQEIIEKFIEIMKSGIVDSSYDSAAIKLRDYLRNSKSNGGYGGQLDAYQKTQSALKAFIDRKQIKSLQSTDKDHFPLVIL